MTEEVRYNYTGYRVYFDKKGKVHRYKEINYVEEQFTEEELKR